MVGTKHAPHGASVRWWSACDDHKNARAPCHKAPSFRRDNTSIPSQMVPDARNS